MSTPPKAGATCVLSPLSASVKLSGRIVKKYQRIRARSSPLNDNVRRRLLDKLGQSSKAVIADMNDQGLGTLDDSTSLPSSVVTLDSVRVLLSKQEHRGLHVLDIDGTGSSLIVYRPYMDKLVGMMCNPRLCMAAVGGMITYSFQVFFKAIAEGSCEPNDLSDIEGYLSQLSDSSRFVVCPGIREYPSTVRFKTKNLVVWTDPFERFFSCKCSQWHIPNNSRQSSDSKGFNCCKACKQLLHDIHQLQQAAESVPDPVRNERLSVSSNYPISKLSPASQLTRPSKANEQRKQYARKLKKLGKFDCDVSDKQHEELVQLVSVASKSECVQELLAEGDRILGEDNNCLKQAWQQDVTERLEYERDQSRAVTSNRGNRWSQLTIRMALAVFSRSPAAYEALRSFKLLQLPCVRTLKYYIDANLETPGDSLDRLQKSQQQYRSLIEEKQREFEEKKKSAATSSLGKDKPEPKCLLPIGEGSLIMDEVKVGMKLIWSSRNQKFVGHAMSHEEMSSLADVYKTLNEDYKGRQTSYIMQMLWRDFTSEFDVVGPHYTSDTTFSHDKLCPILMDTIQQFHLCGFKTVAVVCDGASSNLSMIKEMSGAPAKSYGTNSEADDPYQVYPHFLSPYTNRKVHFIICPSHQLKNMVSALFQSRPRERGGTRELCIGGCTFGWEVIEDMYRRELERIKSNQCSHVPKLKERYICRDSWTRLNVHPSKIMQQDEVLAELKEYVCGSPVPRDAPKVELTIRYLTALNNLFERSLLGKHVRVFEVQGSTIQRMESGYQFFVDWAKEQEPNGDPSKFLAWQTWDLLRVLWYGFKGFVEDFTSSHPGYHVNPFRVNGSAVETLFSQLKHTAGGHLSAANYEACKATLLTKRQTKGKDSYRSTDLHMRQSTLQRKK